MSLPILTTKRLTLRSLKLDDAIAVQLLAGDIAIAEMTLAIPHPYSKSQAEDWIQSQENNKDNEVVWAITQSDSQILIGAIGMILDTIHHKAELGYWIGKPYWKQGYCTEAAKAVLQYGFDTLNLHRIESGHFAKNPASGRVMQKIGMTYEGCRRHARYRFGKYEDLLLYGMLKTDWLRNGTF